ncbi:MAG: hypothetical protein WBW48_00325 [Anaerolineae bacterium]
MSTDYRPLSVWVHQGIRAFSSKGHVSSNFRPAGLHLLQETSDARANASMQFAWKMLGREDELEYVLKQLGQEKVKSLSIIALPGMGKSEFLGNLKDRIWRDREGRLAETLAIPLYLDDRKKIDWPDFPKLLVRAADYKTSEIRDRVKEAILQVQISDKATFADADKLLGALKVKAMQEEDATQQSSAADQESPKEASSSSIGIQVLILIDDFDLWESESIRDIDVLLYRHPNLAGCIVTSTMSLLRCRNVMMNMDVPRHFPKDREIYLSLLPEKKVKEELRQDPLLEKHVNDIVKWTGGHPYLLRQLCEYFISPRIRQPVTKWYEEIAELYIKNIWGLLDPVQKGLLLQVARGKGSIESAKSRSIARGLIDLGLLKERDRNIELPFEALKRFLRELESMEKLESVKRVFTEERLVRLSFASMIITILLIWWLRSAKGSDPYWAFGIFLLPFLYGLVLFCFRVRSLFRSSLHD